MFNGLRFNRLFTKLMLILFCISVFLPGMPLLMKGLSNSVVNATETEYTVSDAVYKTVNYYVYNKNQLENWEEIWALNSAGENLNNDEKWTLPDWEIEILTDESDAREYANKIIGLYSVGKDAGNINGRDLIAELKSKQMDSGSFGEDLNSTYWAIIALSMANANESSDEISKAINYLISQQNDDGGFSSANKGKTSEADATGAVLFALANFSDNEEVANCVTRAINYLNDVQIENGGFAFGNTATAESTAYAIIGLVANEENITSEKWTKDNKTMIDALINFQFRNGSFRHSLDGASDSMATRQALLALSYLKEKYGEYTISKDIVLPEEPFNEEQAVRVRVEGHTSTLVNEKTIALTALGALEAVADDVVLDSWGMIKSILGESGQPEITQELSTSWMYYVIRDGAIEPGAFAVGPAGYNVKPGDEIVFYIGSLDSYWNSKTYLPVVQVTPENSNPGQEIIIKVSAQKYDWLNGLAELSSEERDEIGEYTVKIDQENFEEQTINGEVRIPGLSAGEVEYTITNPNPAGYPDVVTYKGIIKISAPGGSIPQPTGISIKAAVIGKNGELLFGPSILKLSPNSTVLDALSGTGLSYNVRTDGYVKEIAGQKERELGSQSGWKYKVNDDVKSDNARDYKLLDGDRLIWWYAKTIDESGPSWNDVEGVKPGETIKPEKLPEKTGDEIIAEQINKEKEIVISLADREETYITFTEETMNKIIGSNKPLVIKNKGVEINFEPQNLLSEEISEALTHGNCEIKIEVKEIDDNQSEILLEEILKQKGSGLFEVLGKIYEFSFKIIKKNSDDSIIEHTITDFGGFLPITIDLSHVKVINEKINNLTGVRYELDEAGNFVPIKLGGRYNSEEKSFTFFTDSLSLYSVMEAEKITKISLRINRPFTLINGVEGWADVPPTILNDRTMVPVRLIAEALGAQVEWLEEENTVTIKLDSQTMNLPIGELLPGMDTPATMIYYRTMVPLRYISENLGARVMWFSDTQSIEIIK